MCLLDAVGDPELLLFVAGGVVCLSIVILLAESHYPYRLFCWLHRLSVHSPVHFNDIIYRQKV